MRTLILILALFVVADGRAETKQFTDDEQLVIVLFIQKLQQQIISLVKEREEALQERNKMFERLKKQGTCV